MAGLEGLSSGLKPRQVAKMLSDENGNVNFPEVIRQGTQLSVLSKAMGITAATTQVLLLITDFANSYNVFKPMNDDQILDLAEELILDWWQYTLEDFACFFDMAKKNKLGLVKDRVDRGIILQMLDKYEELRREAIFKKEAEPNQSISKDRLNAEFSLADLAPMIRGEKTLNEILEEKRSGVKDEPVVQEQTEEDIERLKAVFDIRLKTFVDDIEREGLSQLDWRSRPFGMKYHELIKAEIERRKSAENGN